MKRNNSRNAGIRIVTAFVLTMVIAGCTAASQSPATPEPQATLKIDSEGVVSAEAVVVPQRETTLAFKVAGRVAQVMIEEGDIVVAGQELARLETRDLEVTLRAAEAGLKSAAAQLAKLQAGPRAEDIAPAETAVTIAEANLATAESSVSVSDGNRAAAVAALAGARATLNKLLAGPTAEEIQIAEKQIEYAKNELWGLQKQRDATLNVIEGQIAAAETNVQITELQLQKLKAGARSEDIAAARATVAQAEAGVQVSQAKLGQAQAQVETAKAELKHAQAQLDLAKAGTRPEDIAVSEAAVVQAETVLAQAQNALMDAVLTAPFPGTVGAVLINEGELVSSQVPAFRIGDLSHLRVETEDLSEVDVSQIQEGQVVAITVDALEGQVFEGHVLRILPIARDRRGDKVYTVTIDPGAGTDSGLRWGMSAMVEITTQAR